MIINVKNTGLTGYYLEQKFQGDDESGLKIIEALDENTPEKIELHYSDKTDLENKISYILMMLTDK